MHPLIKQLTSFKLLYMVVGGILFFLISVIFEPIFIPILPLPESFCQKWIETRSGYQKQAECVEFEDRTSELKYLHNRKMEQRRANKTIGLFTTAAVVTFLLMILNPSVFFGAGARIEDYTGAIATAVFYGIIMGFILPTLLQILLPPPAEWLPEELLEIQNARIELILKQIAKMPK